MKNVVGYFRELSFADLMVQITVGFWLSVTLWISISLKSWDIAVSMSLIAVLVMMPNICRHFWGSDQTWLRISARVGAAGFVGAILFGILMWAEKIYYEGSDSYPTWLATEVSANNSNLDYVIKLRDDACKDYGMLVFEAKDDGKVYARCGKYLYNSKTFVFPFSPLAHMTDKTQ
jgi:hypothetical protein